HDDGRDRLLAFLDSAPRDYRYAVEFRHGSWMRPDIFEALRRREVALVWNEVQYLNTTPEITADFVYLRFIGDRSLSDLGRVQIDRTAEMEKWAGRLRSVEDQVARAYVLFNNHFAGFGPACADQFLRIPSIRLASPAPRRAASFVSLPPVATYTRCPIRRSRSIADLASGNRAFTWARASRSSSRERRSGSPVAGGTPTRSNISWRWRASSSSTTSPYARASQSASFARRV